MMKVKCGEPFCDRVDGRIRPSEYCRLAIGSPVDMTWSISPHHSTTRSDRGPTLAAPSPGKHTIRGRHFTPIFPHRFPFSRQIVEYDNKTSSYRNWGGGKPVDILLCHKRLQKRRKW
uniref:Uncharacterized protein n=1 Tax=Spongospora subterranea TaxID=70186 RepID=A0A0H5QSB9_9EUKA|eukprot:CRZ04918.1 hypothetical protein [Spongospora subterranea]